LCGALTIGLRDNSRNWNILNSFLERKAKCGKKNQDAFMG